jgi:hypothetical protein
MQTGFRVYVRACVRGEGACARAGAKAARDRRGIACGVSLARAAARHSSVDELDRHAKARLRQREIERVR